MCFPKPKTQDISTPQAPSAVADTATSAGNPTAVQAMMPNKQKGRQQLTIGLTTNSGNGLNIPL